MTNRDNNYDKSLSQAGKDMRSNNDPQVRSDAASKLGEKGGQESGKNTQSSNSNYSTSGRNEDNSNISNRNNKDNIDNR